MYNVDFFSAKKFLQVPLLPSTCPLLQSLTDWLLYFYILRVRIHIYRFIYCISMAA